jgi:dihydropteroate synthase
VNEVIIIPINVVCGKKAKLLIQQKKALPLAKDMAFLNFEIQSINNRSNKEKLIYSVQNSKDWKNPYINNKDILDKLKTYNHRTKNFMGLNSNKTQIIGILNVTPDSFARKNKKILKTNEALSKALRMFDEGASIIDIGGESSRPGAIRLDEKEEQKRIIPIIKELSKYNIPISCDTRNSSTMQAAIDAGAKIINDISSLSDERSANIIAKNKVGLILMHMKGQPNYMQKNPKYKNVSYEVLNFLDDKKKYAIQKGIKEENIIIDPGIGFGKNDNHNLKIFRDLTLFHGLKSHILIGASRKSMIGRITSTKVSERLPGSISLAIASIEKGVKFLRVHDIKETKQAIKMWDKINCN